MKTVIMNETLKEIAAKNDTLLTATIELTNKCNFRCEHCYLASHSCEIDVKKVFSLIDELKKCGVLYLTLTGGEIFVYKNIMDVIKYARKLGISVTLFTNLSLLDKDIITELKKLYISEISTTIFSLNNEVNDSITNVKGSLKRIMENVKLVKEAGIPMEIKTPIMMKNVDDVGDVKRFCEDNGFKFNYTSEIVSKLDGNNAPIKLYAKQKNIAKALSFLNYEERVESRKGFNPDEPMCRTLGHNISITCYGEIQPCISFPISYGSIYNTTIEDVWKSSLLKRRLVSIRNSDLKECIKCKYADECLRCPGIAYSEGKDYLGCAPQAKLTATAFQISQEDYR